MCLLIADDIAICADTAINVQRKINVIEKFCSDTVMKVNLKKTEIK